MYMDMQHKRWFRMHAYYKKTKGANFTFMETKKGLSPQWDPDVRKIQTEVLQFHNSNKKNGLA